jgi:lysylphosphatidylglycerol synthase-like protein
MRIFQKAVLGIGALVLAVLLWRMDAEEVGRLVLRMGWGMVLVIAQEIVAHILNATAWRFAFFTDQAAAFSLLELVKLRVAGDAINYLTPSATIAGEFARAAMLDRSHAIEIRAASVVVAKCTQTLGQVFFVLAGLVVVAGRQLPPGSYSRSIVYGVAGAFSLLLVALVIYAASTRRDPEAGTGLPALGGRLRLFVRLHPERFGISTVLFLLGYAWGVFEAYWISHFLGLPVSIGTAVTIEVFSVSIDSILFMVPAKIGTQEGGKTAIFAGLGLPAASGFAFGVVRHIRELSWAGLGLLLYSAHKHAATSNLVTVAGQARDRR